MQIANAVAGTAAEVTVFQRSPNWVTPRRAHTYSGLAKRLDRWPLYRRLHRGMLYAMQEAAMPVFRPGSVPNRLATIAIGAYMRYKLLRRRLVRASLPDYPLGCKRVLVAGDYLKRLADGEVDLVTSAVSRFVPEGIVTEDGKTHLADVVVYATGFRANEFLAPIEVRGKGGVNIATGWVEGAAAYLGMTVPEFPNFFMLYGPNTGVGHTSIIFMVECQVRYIGRLLELMRETSAGEVGVSEAAFQRFNALVEKRLAGSAWTAGCASWYQHASGKVVGIWPYSTARYWWMTRRPRVADYQIR